MRREGLVIDWCVIGLLVYNINIFVSERLFAETNRLDSLRNEREYLAALKAADATTFEKEFEFEFLLLLTRQQEMYYRGLSSLRDRKNYIENYWRAINPNPILPENDVLKEHLRRRAYVRKHFPAKEAPYFDDRGKYYIKYGDPAFRYQDSGGLKQLTLVEMRDDPNADYIVRINESWSYENVARDFVVHFAQIGQTFREIESLTDIIISPRRRSKQAIQWSDIVKKRASISPALGRAAASIEHLETSMRLGTSYLVKDEVVMPNERIFKIEQENKREIIAAIRKAPASAHQPISAVNELGLHHTLQQFRDADGLTRVEVTLFSPIQENLLDLRNDSLVSDKHFEVEFRGLLRNSFLVPVAENIQHFQYPIKLAAKEKIGNVVGSLTFFAPPQTFELTVQVKGELSKKIGFSRQLFDVADFRGDKLMLSDIQFLTEINNSDERAILPAYEKQNLEVAPYPFLKVHKSRSLLCYFEIYNLKSADVEDEYEVTYKLYSLSKSKNIFRSFSEWITNAKDNSISFSYTQPITNENSNELIAIDLSKVPNGDDYRFEITVTETRDKNLTASTSREMAITD